MENNDKKKHRKKTLSQSMFNKQKTMIDLDLNVGFLDNIIQYIFIEPGSNPYVNRKSLANVYNLFNIINVAKYTEDEVIAARIDFIKRITTAQIEEDIYSYDLLINRGMEGIHKNEIVEYIIPQLESTTYVTLSDNDIKFINKYVSERLKYSFFYRYINRLDKFIHDLKTESFESMELFNKNAEELFTRILQDIRMSSMVEDNVEDINFDDISDEPKIDRVVTEIKKPTSHIKTGIIKFNDMLNGGFETGRLYLFLGITGGFKSGLLINILLWLKKYNPKYKTKDPTKRPTIVYLSQENSMKETLERIWGVLFKDEDISEYDSHEISEKIKEKLKATEENEISVSIKYRPNKTISTDDLYHIYDEELAKGREIICFIHDYTKRIRPSQVTGELRLDLGNVVDEERLFAQLKDIPFITAGQMNRKAMEIIEECIRQNQNPMEKLGTSNIGESWLMVENADWLGLLYREEVLSETNPDEESDFYINLKEVKFRGKKPTVFSSFTQPFYKNSGIAILDDVESGKVQSVKSISTHSSNNGFSKTERKRNTEEQQEHMKEVKRKSRDLYSDNDVDDEFDDLE